MHDDDAFRLLHDLVAIPSPSTEEEEAVRFLVRRARELGLDAWRDDAGNFVAEAAPDELDARAPHVVLLGHVDTVPGHIPVRVEDGRLHGRGSVDAKAALVAFLAAATRALGAGTLAARVTVIGCVEEEVPSSRGARAVLGRYRPDLCVVGEPGGWDGVTLGYKGYLRARATYERAVAHGAHAGEGAPELACNAWARLRAAAEAYGGGRERLFERLLVRLAALASGGDGLGQWAALELVLRLPEDLPPERARRWLTEVLVDADLAFGPSVPAWSGPRTSTAARLLARAIAGEGGRPRFVRKTGTADLNLVAPAWGCPAVAYGPGDSALDHTPEEALERTELLRSVRVLERVLAPASLAALGSAEAGADALVPAPGPERPRLASGVL